eukprot:m.17616 g.17616  ORF g.17616 m.17616 type:complete len:146 (-) comp7515_c0_seq1:1220-1657(-)
MILWPTTPFTRLLFVGLEATQFPQLVRFVDHIPGTHLLLAFVVEQLVVYLPTLCRKLNIPYCIVKSKSRLGQLVHQKTATCVAVTNVKTGDQAAFNKLVDAINSNFAERFVQLRKTWGGQIMGAKTNHKVAMMKKKREREMAALL